MIYIIIPVYNRLNYTRECLYALLAQNLLDYKIIVVDHGSTDGTSAAIKKEFPEVILLNETDKLWWTGATNTGIRKALSMPASDQDFILTLNNDLLVSPDYLFELVKVYNANEPAIVGSLSVDIANAEKIDFAGVKWNDVTASYKQSAARNVSYSIIKKEHEWLESDLLPGRGTLFPIRVFRDYGLFDEEKFPHYGADEDYSLVCKKHGLKLLVAVNAYVKSYVTETGVNFTKSKLSFRKFLNSLSAINSANNLSFRYNWAKKNSPLPYLYFFADTFRIFGSYFRSLLLRRSN